MRPSFYFSVLTIAFVAGCAGPHAGGFTPNITGQSQTSMLAASSACTLVRSTMGKSTVSSAVAAASASDAWDFEPKNPPFSNALQAFHFTGASWTRSPFPATSLRLAFLRSAHAIAANDVWAVGTGSNAGNSPLVPLVYHWNGSTWSAVSHPTWPSIELDAVSADASNNVWIVGEQLFSRVFLIHWNGSTWTLKSFSYSTDSASGLVVFGPYNVWISFVQDNGTAGAYLLHWNGTTVTPVPLPLLNHRFPQSITGLKGTSPTDIWTVGTTRAGNYIAHYHGSWIPFVSESNGQTIESVAPFRYGYAVATTYASGYTGGGLLVYNGVDRWRVTTNPFPPGMTAWFGPAVIKNSTSFWAEILTNNGNNETPALIQCPANPPPPLR